MVLSTEELRERIKRFLFVLEKRTHCDANLRHEYIINYLVSEVGVYHAILFIIKTKATTLLKKIKVCGEEDMEKAKIAAIRGDNFTFLSDLLEVDGRVSTRVLLEAITIGNLDVIECLVNETRTLDRSLLLRMFWKAVALDHFDVVRYLFTLDLPIDINKELETFQQSRNTTMVELLLDMGARIDLLDLRRAVTRQDWQMVLLFIEREVDANQHINYALRNAIRRKQLGVVKACLKAGANVNAGITSPLVLAVESKSIDIVKVLIDHGAVVDIKGGRALYLAVRNRDLDLVGLLVEEGATIELGRRRALRLAARQGSIDIVKYLLDRDVPWHADFLLALKAAIKSKEKEVLKFFVDRGVPLELVIHRLIEYTVTVDDVEILAYLFKFGKIDLDRWITTAAKNGSKRVIQYLVELEDKMKEEF